MSWNSRSFFGTVKFKVALSYAALFAFSAAVSFCVIYAFMSRNMLQSADAQLEENAREIIFEYLTGNKLRRFDRELAIAQVPQETLAAFRRRIPGLVPVAAMERETQQGRFCTVIGHAGGKLYELRLESGGTVFARTINPADHLVSLRKTFIWNVYSEGSQNIFFRLLRPDGAVIFQSDTPELLKAAAPPGAEAVGEAPSFTTEQFFQRNFRVMRRRLFDGSILEIGRSLHRMDHQLEYYTTLFGGVIAAVLLIGGFSGWLIARRFISGVERVSRAARKIARGDFSRRVAIGNEGVEIDSLVESFNRMNANTEKLFQELQMVTDNVAHDLRTPLTRMRGMAEIAVCGPQDPAAYRDLAGAVAEECNQMLLMINTMLEITRTESCLESPSVSEFQLDELLARAHELLSPLAESDEIDFPLELPPEPVIFRGDKLKIQRMVANLVENALKFTPSGGRVMLRLERSGESAVITVEDTGCGISAEDQKHVFERFFRSDASRTLPGNGLGLSLVQAIVTAHCGTIELESEPGRGTTFTVKLPVSGKEPVQPDGKIKEEEET